MNTIWRPAAFLQERCAHFLRQINPLPAGTPGRRGPPIAPDATMAAMRLLLLSWAWPELRHNPWRSLTAVVAVAVGVALALVVQHLINQSALEEFAGATRAVNGEPDVEAARPGRRFRRPPAGPPGGPPGCALGQPGAGGGHLRARAGRRGHAPEPSGAGRGRAGGGAHRPRADAAARCRRLRGGLVRPRQRLCQPGRPSAGRARWHAAPANTRRRAHHPPARNRPPPADRPCW